jgi:outer membrane protein OmpA-like peptidoglycan-associated protein
MKKGTLFLLFFILAKAGSAQSRDSVIVYFNSAKADISDRDKNRLDSVFSFSKPVKILIEAHCDKIGSDAYNDGLSERRAQEVWEYLHGKNFINENVPHHGFGKRRLINGNNTEEERALNRRVVVSFERKVDLPIKDGVVIMTEQEFTAPVPKSISADAESINVDSIEVGSTFQLENLNFEGGRHILLKKAEKPLQLLLKTMQDNPTMEIVIEGHICCLLDGGDGRDIDTRTDDLSINRAKAVYNYLVQHGIDPRRMHYRGYGSSRKLVPERTEEDRTMNRRVEIKVVGK